MFTDQAAQGLKSFVKKGGYVLSEARLAWNDERGFAMDKIPGMGLHVVFAAVEQKVKMEKEVVFKTTENKHVLLSGLKAGEDLKGAYFAESLDILENPDAEILARLNDNSAGIVASKYGKGETVLIGSFMGMANHPEANKNNTKFLLNMLKWADISLPFESSKDNPVEVRLSKSEDNYLLYIINHVYEQEQVEIKLNVDQNGDYRLTEMISNRNINESSKNKSIIFKTTINGRDAQVWNIGMK